jgi:benzoate-CoA ligase
VPGYALRIVGDDGKDCALGESWGSYWLPAHLGHHVLEQPGKTKATFCGRLDGDKYTLDADGYCPGGRSDGNAQSGRRHVSQSEIR